MRQSRFLALLALCAPSGAAASTLVVPTQYPTIQAAVDAARPGDAIRIRSRHLRAISVRHHNRAREFLSKPALLEHARHLGRTVGKTLAAESMDELTLAFDLAISTPGRRDTRGRA